MIKKTIKRWIKKRLRDYHIQINPIDPNLPKTIPNPKTVVVIGAGLAGIACASVLAERGFKVIIKEKNSFLGGKLGAWPHELQDGKRVWVDHGFHAFFYHYYNLRTFFKKIGSDRHLAPIGEYLIHGETIHLGFRDTETTPLLNLLDMRRKGFFRYRDMFTRPAMLRMVDFLKYSEDACFARFDDTSFQEFADRLRLPRTMRTVFISFTRAFFADPDKMSLAELMKSFHFFYLSHDYGILYDYLRGDCHHLFAEPVQKHFRDAGIRLDLETRVEQIEPEGNRIRAGETVADYCILAADAPAARRIAAASPWIGEQDSSWYERLLKLKPAQGYAVYKVWIDRRLEKGFPAFFITDRSEVLDAIAQFHQIDASETEWSQETGGGVYELHCYAVPNQFSGDAASMKRTLFGEFKRLFPEIAGATIIQESFHMNDNFTAFHVGLHAQRPGRAGLIPNLFAAGDWVKIETPAMLMEGAFTSGMLAANEVLKRENLAEEPVFSVPLSGLLAKPVRL